MRNQLPDILSDPSKVMQIPVAAIPALLLEIASLHAALAARLLNGSENAGTQGNSDQLLGVKEAAAKLSVTEDWLYRRGGKLPFVVRIGRNIRFSEQGIEKFIKQRIGR